MKIEIDLNEVLRDGEDEAGETLEESVRRQVISRLTEDYRKRLFSQFDAKLSAIMNEQISAVMAERMPEFIGEIFDAEYQPVSRYGDRGEKTTFRAEIIKSVADNMVYAPKTYSHEENAFTKAVKSIVELKTKEVKDAITAQVDAKFKQDAIAFAVQRLSERLGLTALSK